MRRVRLPLLLVMLSASAVAAQPLPFDPLDADGWPKGVSLEATRELRPCERGELVVEPGAEIRCRPPITVGGAHVAFAIDWSTGPVFDRRSSGGAHAMGVELAYAATRSLQLVGRYELFGIGRTEPGRSVGNQFLGLAKYRIWTDEVGRDAWTLGAGGGWAIRNEGLGGSAPIARVSLARERGFYLDDNNSVFSSLELAYERTLDSEGLSTILASYRWGFELNIHEPTNLGTRAREANHRLTHTYDIYGGNALALGSSIGVRLLRPLSVQASAGFQFGTTEQTKQHGFDGGQWSTIVGPRLQLTFSQVAPYVQVQAGPSWVSHTTGGGELRGMGHAELGIRALIGCSAADVGVWGRIDLETRDATAGGLLMRIVLGAPEATFSRGAHCGRDDETPHFATEPPPPPTMISEPPQQQIVTRLPPPAQTSVELQPPPPVRIDVAVQPLVVDLELGVVLPGVRISVDASRLPLELRAAGIIDVEIIGPDGAIRAYRAELDSAIARDGGQVRSWRLTPSSSPVVHARFTIWPR